jgi:predicted nuclease with TOPRIM domain
MFTSSTTPSYSTQTSNVSIGSSDSDASSPCNTVEYGPITVRLCRKSAPTLENGRRSKHLILVGDEAVKREKRRERNRDAARKLKEKRQQIEEELNEKLKQLEGEHSNLQNFLQHLNQRKQNLQTEVENLQIDPIIKLLSNDNQDMPLFFEQHSDDMDLSDESIEEILNFDLNKTFSAVLNN